MGGTVLDAIDMAVDEDGISASCPGAACAGRLRLRRQPAGRRWRTAQRWFDREGAKAALRDSGVAGVTLTIAADAGVPEAGAIAEGIAADLRANIGAQVTVVNGGADFIVTRAAPPPTPVPTLDPATVAFEHTCTPDTIRPDEWVVIECVARTTNESQDALTDVGWSVGGTFDGPIPTSFFVWSKRDGEFQPLGTGHALRIGGYNLKPGQTAETRNGLPPPHVGRDIHHGGAVMGRRTTGAREAD